MICRNMKERCYRNGCIKYIERGKRYVEEGAERTYAIILESEVDDNFDFEDGYVRMSRT